MSAPLRSHLAYLRYVLLHKLYVLRAGIIINGWSIPWLWRLLVHDRSKFSRAEWTPYVCQFYGPSPTEQASREVNEHFASYHPLDRATLGDTREHMVIERVKRITAERKRAFDAAWLHHIHANPHHWQHWILHEDSGKVIVLVMPLAAINEMVADWIGAGSKILRRPSMADCVAETIVWYANAARVMMLRADVRAHVEETLMALARKYRLDRLAATVEGASQKHVVTL